MAAAMVAPFGPGCDDDAEEQRVPTEQRQTHDEPLPEDFAGVECVFDDRGQFNSEPEPLIYGVVSAPKNSEQTPAGSVDVTLVETSEHGVHETAIAGSETDEEGRWCFQLDADRIDTASLMVITTVDDTKLRRLVDRGAPRHRRPKRGVDSVSCR